MPALSPGLFTMVERRCFLISHPSFPFAVNDCGGVLGVMVRVFFPSSSWLIGEPKCGARVSPTLTVISETSVCHFLSMPVNS